MMELKLKVYRVEGAHPEVTKRVLTKYIEEGEKVTKEELEEFNLEKVTKLIYVDDMQYEKISMEALHQDDEHESKDFIYILEIIDEALEDNEFLTKPIESVIKKLQKKIDYNYCTA